MGDLNRRKGVIMDSSTNGDDCIIQSEVPLNAMFGYSSVLRSNTQGKGEYSMAYSHHAPVSRDLQEELMTGYARTAGGKAAATAA